MNLRPNQFGKSLLRRQLPFLATVLLAHSACVATVQQSMQMRPETAKAVKDATVLLNANRTDGTSQGSGFFALAARGLVVTAAHVVVDTYNATSQPPAKVDVVLNRGKPNEKHLAGKVVAIDRRADQAIIKVEGGGKLPAPLPVATKLYEGETVYAFGFPAGSKNVTASKPSNSSLYNDVDGPRIQFNGGMQAGSSGGPVTNARGEVVGVLVTGRPGTPINFASPMVKARTVLAPVSPSKPSYNSAPSPTAASLPKVTPIAATPRPTTNPLRASPQVASPYHGRK